MIIVSVNQMLALPPEATSTWLVENAAAGTWGGAGGGEAAGGPGLLCLWIDQGWHVAEGLVASGTPGFPQMSFSPR